MVTPEGTTAPAACSTSAVHALGELQRVCQGFTVYGGDHPAVHHAASAAAASLKETGGVHVFVRGTSLSVKDLPLDGGSSTELLRERLVALRIASLNIRSTAEAVDVLALARIMGQCKADHRWALSDAEDLSRQTEGRIEALPINYAGLRIRDGAGTEKASLDLDWSWISQDLVRVAEGAGGITAAELAARVNSSLDAEIGGLPSNVLEAAAQSLEHASPEQRAAGEARLTMFFSLLGANVLEATARIDSARPSRSLQSLFQVAGAMSPAPVVSGLEQVDTSTLGTPDGLRLLAKLVWISQDQQRLSERLSSILSEVGQLLLPLREEADELRGAVNVLQEAVEGHDFATEDYQDLLVRLEGISAPVRVRDPGTWSWTAESARVHAAMIAVDLLAAPATPLENLEGAATYLQTHLAAVVDSGAFDVFLECASAIAAAATRPLPPGASIACAGLSRQICDPDTIVKVLAHMRAKGSADQLLAHAIACCGVSAMIPVLQKAAIGKLDLDPSLLVNDPSVSIRDLASELFRKEPATLQRLAMDRVIDRERRARFAHALLAVEDPVQREAAYRVFNELYTTWPRSLVAHALMDDHAPICELAVAHVDTDSSNLHSVGVMLTGGLGFIPEARLFNAGTTALVRAGDAATLQHVAVTLLKSLSPRGIKRAWSCYRLASRTTGGRR